MSNGLRGSWEVHARHGKARIIEIRSRLAEAGRATTCEKRVKSVVAVLGLLGAYDADRYHASGVFSSGVNLPPLDDERREVLAILAACTKRR